MPVRSNIPVDYPLEEISVPEFIFREARKHGDHRTAIFDKSTGNKFSYVDLERLSQTVAANLQMEGLEKGDIVVLLLPNCANFITTMLGVMSAGGVFCGMNPVYTKEEIMHVLQESRVTIFISAAELLSSVQHHLRNIQTLKKVFSIGKHLNGTIPFERLLRSAPNFSPPKIDARSDLVALPFSSGTTGLPKGVMLTHFNMVTMILILSRAKGDLPNKPFDISPGQSVTVMLPLFHMFGKMMAMHYMTMGAQLILRSRFVFTELLQDIQDYKVMRLDTVPPVANLLAKSPEVDKYDISCLQCLLVGGSPLSEQLAHELRQRLPTMRTLTQGYGMTEVTTAASWGLPRYTQGRPLTCCGALVPFMEAKIVDIETERELSMGERGELWLRGPLVMKGYINRPNVTAEAITPDGWLKTGDIGYLDEQKCVYIVDRKKELIKVKGFQVPPAELEDLLLGHSKIADAAVTRVVNQATGFENPKAFVVTRPGQHLTELEVKNFVKAKVAPYKQLTGGVSFVSEIPKSPSGKILRRKLRQTMQKDVMSKL